jgi:hypothetical protein
MQRFSTSSARPPMISVVTGVMSHNMRTPSHEKSLISKSRPRAYCFAAIPSAYCMGAVDTPLRDLKPAGALLSFSTGSGQDFPRDCLGIMILTDGTSLRTAIVS